MKIKITPKQLSSVVCPTCGVVAGKQCVLVAGGLRNEPHPHRKVLAAEALERKRTKRVNRVTKKESDAAWLAELKRELARPYLAKSVREKATKKQIESWSTPERRVARISSFRT
jgi:hypothetical protein